MMNKDDTITLDVTIRERPYQIACVASERDSVLELVAKFEDLVLSISDSAHSKGSDALIFLIAGLKLEDQIKEMENKLRTVIAEMAKYKSEAEHHLQSEVIINDLCMYVVGRIEKIVHDLSVSENIDNNVNTSD